MSHTGKKTSSLKEGTQLHIGSEHFPAKPMFSCLVLPRVVDSTTVFSHPTPFSPCHSSRPAAGRLAAATGSALFATPASVPACTWLAWEVRLEVAGWVVYAAERRPSSCLQGFRACLEYCSWHLRHERCASTTRRAVRGTCCSKYSLKDHVERLEGQLMKTHYLLWHLPRPKRLNCKPGIYPLCKHEGTQPRRRSAACSRRKS